MDIAWTTWCMRSVIAAVFVLCLFGPYFISILIGGLVAGCYLFKDETGSAL